MRRIIKISELLNSKEFADLDEKTIIASMDEAVAKGLYIKIDKGISIEYEETMLAEAYRINEFSDPKKRN